MTKRHETPGIKQTVRYEWMQKTSNLLLAGLDAKSIRRELHEFLASRSGKGTDAKRGITSRSQVVNILMNIWIEPDPDLTTFRNCILQRLQENSASDLASHWALISAAYPFWFNVARQVGRLLNLQDQVTQNQIIKRIKKQYGDRQTVHRYARYVIYSFVAWGVLKGSKSKGSYERHAPIEIDATSTNLLLESALQASPDGNMEFGSLLRHPAFFPFRLPDTTGDYVSRRNNQIEITRYGLDQEVLRLIRKTPSSTGA